jgi:hypothetical protein
VNDANLREYNGWYERMQKARIITRKNAK